MRHQRNLVHLRQRVEARPGRAVTLGLEAQTVHTGIHFKKHAVRQLRLVRRQHVDLLVAMHDVPQAKPRTQLQIARIKAAFQQKNRPAPVQCPQALRFGQIQQRKAVGAAQAVKCALYAVPVGVGLDDGPDLGVGRCSTHTRQVVNQGCGMNGGKNRAGHDKLTEWRVGFF